VEVFFAGPLFSFIPGTTELETGIAESLLLLWYNMICNDKERIQPGKEE
jgi:hypothetical protein